MGALEVLNLESGTISQAELKEMLGLIRVGAERQERLARKLIRYFSLEQRLQAPRSGGPERCKAEVAVTAGAAQAGHEQKRAGDLVISVEPAEIAVHPEGLQDAVYEIVSNALTFSAGNTPVTVNGRKHERRYRIEISDQGPGMSAAERAAIGAFTQFGREKREQQGLGLGLAIAAASARLAQGEFSLAAGENDRGLKAIFDLPLAL
jgi:signal transduction histidine kinase